MSTYRSPGPGLFGNTRSALLALLYGHAGESYYVRQIARVLGGGHGALQRELKHLAEMGLLVRSTRGNQVLYQANQQNPIFPELRSLVAKTFGIHDMIRSSLAGLGDRIQTAFIYGSVAHEGERPDSDVDLLVIGEASFREVVTALAPAQRQAGREINPSVFSASEFRSKLKAGNHFLTSVMRGKKIFVLGTQHELANLAAK